MFCFFAGGMPLVLFGASFCSFDQEACLFVRTYVNFYFPGIRLRGKRLIILLGTTVALH